MGRKPNVLTMVSAGFHCLPLQMVRPYLKRETEDVLLHTFAFQSTNQNRSAIQCYIINTTENLLLHTLIE